MPNLQLGAMAKEAAKQRFRSFNLTLPAVRQGLPPSPMRPPLPGPPVPSQSAPLPFPPALFRAASNSPSDVANQRAMNETYNGIIDGALAAIEFGFQLWKLTAGLVNIQINGPVAAGGRLQGQPMDVVVRNSPAFATWTGPSAALADAIARGFGMQWNALCLSVSVPGLPWYPTFAAVPAPVAPPTMNVPCPFISLRHDEGATSTANLINAMRASLRGSFDYSQEIFDSIASCLQMPIMVWKTSQMVTQVMGTGPVPGFAPPHQPVGMVVGGSTLPGPHFTV